MGGIRRTAPELSIVVPVFNEEDSLLLLYGKIRAVCDELGKGYEVIFVDDGSSDGTYGILSELHGRGDNVKVVRLRKNYGQTAAMAAGFRASRGNIIISMDADLQNDPADIPLLLDSMGEGYDVVCGWRKDRKDKLISRRLPSVIANWLIGVLTGVRIHDNGCSLKAYRSEVIKRVSLYSELHRFIPAMSSLTGARIGEVVVRHHPRRFGASKYGISRIWRVFLDLFLIKMLTGFAAKPALWFGMLGFPAVILGTVCFSLALMPGVRGVVLPTLAFLLLSLAGHFLVLGVISEFVLRTGNFRPEAMLVVCGGMAGKQAEEPRWRKIESPRTVSKS